VTHPDKTFKDCTEASDCAWNFEFREEEARTEDTEDFLVTTRPISVALES
jgi:hypothetical protein